MGGHWSTRWDGHARKCTTEDSFGLQIKQLRPYLQSPSAQLVRWGWSHEGESVGQIEFVIGAVTIAPPTISAGDFLDISRIANSPLPKRSLTFLYKIVREGSDEHVEQQIALVAHPMRFGGFRWWFECPWCRSFRTGLYLPTIIGASRWRCRHCFGLRYLSQRLGPTARSELRMQRIAKKLNSGWWDSWLDFPPPKPKWMRHATYGREVDRWERASSARDGIFAVMLGGIVARWSKD